MNDIKDVKRKYNFIIKKYYYVGKSVIVYTDKGNFIVKRTNGYDKDNLYNSLSNKKFFNYVRPYILDDDYEIYPYMNQNNKVNNNQNKINENKTLQSNADKHTKISSINGVPTDIYGVNDNNNEKGKENIKKEDNNNNKNNKSNNTAVNNETKDKYSKSRVERVIRNSVVDLTELNKHNFDDNVDEKDNNNNNDNENNNKENVIKED